MDGACRVMPLHLQPKELKMHGTMSKTVSQEIWIIKMDDMNNSRRTCTEPTTQSITEVSK